MVIAVDAEINACDELAAEPLDIQAVTEGVLPNDIKVDEALAACEKAVGDFPRHSALQVPVRPRPLCEGRFSGAR